jgi:hypothetical protein
MTALSISTVKNAWNAVAMKEFCAVDLAFELTIKNAS